MKAYTLFIQEPLLETVKIISKKTDTSASELIRTAIREFVETCLKRGLINEDEAHGIYTHADADSGL